MPNFRKKPVVVVEAVQLTWRPRNGWEPTEAVTGT